ncbi:hypothetical protein MYX84_09010 [Acidobacteria bacterium AH-259-O06]|nr:hypothetical protein [Acidobacteria bacterium AH-259-O06]
MRNVSALAKREMAKEKRELAGKQERTPTPLEQAAEKLVREQEQKEKEQGREEKKKPIQPWRIGREEEEKRKETPFEPVSKADFTGESTSKSYEGFDWRSYNAGLPEKKEKRRYLNTATIWLIGRKMMAREWRKAKGKSRPDRRLEQLEREAKDWFERKELERKKEEAKKEKSRYHFDKLQEVVKEFALEVAEKKDERDPEEIKAMFKEHLKSVGNPYKVEWSKEACRIWYEPWEETTGRKISMVTKPVMYTAFVDTDMNVTSLERTEDDGSVSTAKQENLADIFEKLLEDESLDPDEDEIDDLLQQTITEVGRLVSFRRTDSGWIAAVEPWQQMRVRNTQRSGEEVGSLTHIYIDQTDGKFRFKITSS